MTTTQQTQCQQIVTFEHALNEPIRICLKIEALYRELNFHSETEIDNSLSALCALLKLINVADRPDIKSKITQMMMQYASALNQLKRYPQVDQERLMTVISQLDSLNRCLHDNQEKIAAQLKANEFLNQLRLKIAHPGGICPHSSSALKLWLALPNSQKQTDIENWSSHLKQLHTCAELLLSLARESSIEEECCANKGFFQKNLNPTLPCDLLHINLLSSTGVYPEFSAGRHRLSLRFLEPNFYGSGPAKQTSQNIQFVLGYCRM